MAYIGRTTEPLPHWPVTGTVVAVMAPDMPDAADVLVKWVRDGLRVEAVPIEWVRLHYGTAEPSPEKKL